MVRQITSVLEDIGTDIVKTGMLSRRALIEHVAQTLADAGAPMIVDPVMVATSGDRLLDEDAVSALGDLLVNHAFLVTPNCPKPRFNLPDTTTPDDMKQPADTLMDAQRYALIKGGHGTGNVVTDLLALQRGFEVFEHERLGNPQHPWMGCTPASAIAGQLAAQIAGGTPPDLAPDREPPPNTRWPTCTRPSKTPRIWPRTHGARALGILGQPPCHNSESASISLSGTRLLNEAQLSER